MDIREFHWLMNIVQNLDVGLVVLDREYRIQVWNGFMESLAAGWQARCAIRGCSRSSPMWTRPGSSARPTWCSSSTTVPSAPGSSALPVALLQLPPHHGIGPYMYQNLTLVPLADFAGEVTHLAIIIYDATDEAMLITGQRQG